MRTIYHLHPRDSNNPASNPPQFEQNQLYSGFPYDRLNFDGTTEETTYWNGLVVPYGFSPGSDLELGLHWHPASSSGNVMWGFSILSQLEGGAPGSGLGSEVTVVDTAPDTDFVFTVLLVTAVTLIPGQPFGIKLARKAADSLDTLNAIDARLLGADLREV